ncbi:hypothetical protein ACLB2K_005827 [Fragaria x ananassa]
MAKRFRLRISRVIPSFQSCSSKDPSSLPSNPVPSFLRPSPSLNHHLSTPPSKPNYSSSIKRHVSSAFGCGFGIKPTLSDDDNGSLPPEVFEWEREDKWHVVAMVDEDKTPRRKIYTSSASVDSERDDAVSLSFSPPPPPPPSSAETKKKQRLRKKKTTTSRMIRFSTSSAESGLFSDEDEENETLFSFSTDSSADIFTRHLATIRETPPRRRKKIKSKAKRSVSRTSGEFESPRLSVFQRLIPCSVDGKVRESFAVVKKSEDPYEDFKRSMMEMILEKQMFHEKELEQLLHCFLSLNAREHHRVIVQAFSEIWEAIPRRFQSRAPKRMYLTGNGTFRYLRHGIRDSFPPEKEKCGALLPMNPWLLAHELIYFRALREMTVLSQ